MNHVLILKKIGVILFMLIIVSGVSAESSWYLESTPHYKQKVTIAGFLDEKNGITAGYAGAVHYSSDGGKTWPQGKNNSWCRFGLEILDTENAWTCGNQGHVRVSHDSGRTWKSVANFGQMEPHQCRYLSFYDAVHGWIASEKRLAVTNDGAKTWRELSLPKAMKDISAIHFLPKGLGFVLTSDGVLHVTRDKGETWHTVRMNLNGHKLLLNVPLAPAAAIRFRDEKQGSLVFLRDGEPKQWTFMRTADGGKIWKEESLPEQVVALGRGTVFMNHDATIITINDIPKKTIYLIHRR